MNYELCPGGFTQSMEVTRQVPEEYEDTYPELVDTDQESPEYEYSGETQTHIVRRVLGILSEWEKQSGRNRDNRVG